MREVGAVEIADRQFAEDVVEDRGRRLDRVVALDHARRLEPGEGEGVDEFLERDAVLQPDRDGDGEVVHHRPESGAFLVHVDEDFTKRTIGIFAGPEVNLVAADDGLLGIALAPLRHFFAFAVAHFAQDDLLDDLLGQDRDLLGGGAGLEHLGRLVIFAHERGGERLGELGAVAVERIGLDAERPAQLVGALAVVDRGRIRHVDRLADRARDEALRRRHHRDVAFDREIAPARLAAGIGAVEDRQVFGAQVGGAFQRHRPADMIVGGVDLGLGEAEMAQEVEAGIGEPLGRDAQRLLAEFLAQGPLVEDEADVEGLRQRRLDARDLGRAEAMAKKRGAVDVRRLAERLVPLGMGHDLADLGLTVAELAQRGGDGLIDDLEVTPARKLLEFHQCKIGLDPGRVAIHDKPDRAGGRDHGCLGVAVAVLFAQSQRLVPGGHGDLHEPAVGAIGMVERDGGHVHALVAVLMAMRGAAVVADHAQHVGAVARETREGAKLARDLGAGGIGHARHDRGQRAGKRPARVRVVAAPHVHQEPADIGIAKPQRAEVIGEPGNLARGELRHHHRDFERQRPEPGRVDVVLDPELPVAEEGQQVHRGEVAGGVVEEHVFRAGIRAPDRPVLGAGMPGVDGVVELDAGVGTGPGGMADLIPETARLERLCHLAVAPGGQMPVAIGFDCLEEGIRDADRVVGVLARDAGIGLGIPVGIVGREFDAVEALAGIVQHALDVSVGDRDFFRLANRLAEALVHGRVETVIGIAVPGAQRGEDAVQHPFVHLRARDDRGDLLLLDHLPVDEGLDIGVVGIDDDHLGRAPRGAARLDRARGAVADLEKPHQPRGASAARQLFALAAQRGEVRARARAVLEEPRLAHPEVHNAALVDEVIGHRLDEAGMGLGMFVGRVGLDQFAALPVDIEMPLRRPVDAIGPVQAGIEPLR